MKKGSNIRPYTFFVGITIMIFLAPQSCTEEITELTRANRIIADSIFREEEKILVKEIDSLCDLAYKGSFDRAVDSIAAIRIKEIEEINSR